jgi:hypothetical protein
MSKRIGIYFFMSAAIAVAVGCFRAFTGEDKNDDLEVCLTIAAIMASSGLPFYFYKSKIKPMFSDAFEGKEEKLLRQQIRSGETGMNPNSQMLLEMVARQNQTLRQIKYGVIALVVVFVILPALRSC